MRIGFIGLGKLGLPVALAVQASGHRVYGFDASPEVLENIRARRLIHHEPDAGELLASSSLELLPLQGVVEAAEILFVAVQTPHAPELGGAARLPPYRRDFDYSHLKGAASLVGEAASGRSKTLTLAVISTVLPGTLEREIKPLLPSNVVLAYNPFFTAMGTTVRDFLKPEFVLLGADHAEASSAEPLLREFYATLHDSPVFSTDIRTAELIKVAYNTFIGQKIVFANTMMELSHKLGTDVDALSGALALAHDRIISPRYLHGGMGDGGPCHPRDNVALSWLAREVGLAHDIFGDMMQAREQHTEWLADLIAEHADGLPIVVLGKAFKPSTELADGSPALLLASILRERGIQFSHHDSYVDHDPVRVERRPASLYFIATRHPEYQDLAFAPGSLVLDPWGYIPDRDGVQVVRIGRR